MTSLEDAWKVLEATPKADTLIDAQLFDFFMEAGHEEIAYTLRWMRENNKWPQFFNKYESSSGKDVHVWWMGWLRLRDKAYLETKLWDLLPKEILGTPRSAAYTSIRKAIEALAVALTKLNMIPSVPIGIDC